jgi:hypothetical protein
MSGAVGNLLESENKHIINQYFIPMLLLSGGELVTKMK